MYAAQTPLEEGEEKHIISVFVADESGIINRVAGVFARRGVHPGQLASFCAFERLAAVLDVLLWAVWAPTAGCEHAGLLAAKHLLR